MGRARAGACAGMHARRHGVRACMACVHACSCVCRHPRAYRPRHCTNETREPGPRYRSSAGICHVRAGASRQEEACDPTMPVLACGKQRRHSICVAVVGARPATPHIPQHNVEQAELASSHDPAPPGSVDNVEPLTADASEPAIFHTLLLQRACVRIHGTPREVKPQVTFLQCSRLPTPPHRALLSQPISVPSPAPSPCRVGLESCPAPGVSTTFLGIATAVLGRWRTRCPVLAVMLHTPTLPRCLLARLIPIKPLQLCTAVAPRPISHPCAAPMCTPSLTPAPGPPVTTTRPLSTPRPPWL